MFEAYARKTQCVYIVSGTRRVFQKPIHDRNALPLPVLQISIQNRNNKTPLPKNTTPLRNRSDRIQIGSKPDRIWIVSGSDPNRIRSHRIWMASGSDRMKIGSRSDLDTDSGSRSSSSSSQRTNNSVGFYNDWPKILSADPFGVHQA